MKVVNNMVGSLGKGAMTFGRLFISFMGHFHSIAVLIARIFTRLPLVFKNFHLSVEQMFSIGITSVPLVTVIALFVGAVTVMQVVYQFSGWVPLRYLGLAVCKSFITELAPVLVSLVISGRISTAIAAEIGSMKTSEQLDALTILDLDPIRYLVIPKVLACVLMLPCLVIWAELIGFIGAIITVLLTVDVSLNTYLTGMRLFFQPLDLFVGIGKTSVFGAIIALVGCHFGYQTKGGAEGVGSATTKAVMVASALILIFDFLIAFLLLR